MLNRGLRSAIAPSSQHAPSYYADTIREGVTTQPLRGCVQTEVCVIGGGFTGLTAALHLARNGIGATVLEQSLIGWGASGRNGGQIHVGLRQNLAALEKHFGKPTAREGWALALRAREHLDWLIDAYSIPCDRQAGLVHADHTKRHALATVEYVEYMRKEYDYRTLHLLNRQEIRDLVATDDYFGGSLDERGGHLHPLNFALGIARAALSHGASLHEQSAVTRVERLGEGWRVSTRDGQVSARYVVLACNGYLQGLSETVEAHVMPINNFIAVTEVLGPERAAALIRNGYAVADSRFVVFYYRMTPDHRLMFGGGENYTYRFPQDIAARVRKNMQRTFPQLAGVGIDYAWGGTLAITPTRMPFIHEVEPGLFNGSGFSGKGVVMAPYVGRVIAEAIAGRRTELNLLSRMSGPRFPGGAALRTPLLITAMSAAALLDRL